MAPLERQVLQFPIRGLDTKADPKTAPPGTCDLIENFRFQRTGAGGAELVKRNGGTAMTRGIQGGGTIALGKKLATFNDERMVVGDRIFTFSPILGTWVDRGPSSAVAMSVEPMLSAPVVGGTHDYDIAVHGTLMCLVTSSGHVTVIDLATGTRLLSHVDAVLSAGVGGDLVRVIALDTVFMLLGCAAAGANIVAKSIAYATPTVISGATTAVNDGNAAARWDAVRNGTNDSVMIAYRSNVPGIKIKIWNSNMTAGATATNADDPSLAIGFFDWDASDARLYFGYAGGAVGAKFATITTAGAISSTTVMDAAIAANVRNITGYRSGTTNTAFIEISAATSFNTLVRRWSAAGASAVWQRSVGIAARAFKVGGNYFLPCTYASPLQSGYYVLDANGTTPGVVTKALYGVGGGLTPISSLRNCPPIDSTTAAVPVIRVVDTLPDGSTVQEGCFLRLRFGSRAISAPKHLGESLYLAGGMIRNYDGANASSEAGFHLFPEKPVLSQGGGGALTVNGVYKYRFCYAWYDGRGQTHRSSPSEPVGITMAGANQTVTVPVPTLRITEKPVVAGLGGGTSPTLFVEAYRTVAGGTTYYRHPVSNLFNDPTVDTVTFNDIVSDAVIQSDLILYTDGGTLPHIPLPPARIIESWRGRLIMAGTENPLELWIGNELVPGEGISASDALVIQMEAEGGPITAICELDDRLVIFKETAIYVLSGNGPAANGDGQFDQPARVSSTIGSIDTAVVRFRDGIMFKSTRGIHVFTTSQQVVYMGQVEAFNGLTLTGGAAAKSFEEVRLTTAEGRTLVYHYGLPDESGKGRWTTFTNQAAVDAIVWNGTFVTLASDGTVTEEGASTWTDPGPTTYTAKARFTWICPAQVVGRSFLYGLEALTVALADLVQVTMRVAFDFNPAVVQSGSRTISLASPPLVRLEPAQGHIVAVQATIEELSTTQGISLGSFGIEVGPLPGAQRLPVSQYLQ